MMSEEWWTSEKGLRILFGASAAIAIVVDIALLNAIF